MLIREIDNHHKCNRRHEISKSLQFRKHTEIWYILYICTDDWKNENKGIKRQVCFILSHFMTKRLILISGVLNIRWSVYALKFQKHSKIQYQCFFFVSNKKFDPFVVQKMNCGAYLSKDNKLSMRWRIWSVYKFWHLCTLLKWYTKCDIAKRL